MPDVAPRQINDMPSLRALAHPVRVSLIEALAVHGRLTATQASELVGESPSNCSFHLRQLAKYGFVEEAPGGKGRERPWRAVDVGFSLSDEHEDPDVSLAAGTLARVLSDRWLERARAGFDRRHLLPEDWRKATGFDEMTLYVTPDEMRAVKRALDPTWKLASGVLFPAG